MATYDHAYASNGTANPYHPHHHLHDGPAPITRALRGAPASNDYHHQQHYVHEDEHAAFHGGDSAGAGGYGADDDSGLYSDDEVAEALQGTGQGRFQYHHHDGAHDPDAADEYGPTDDDGEPHPDDHDDHVEGAEEDLDDTASFSDSLSSSPSIPDDDIDFNLVYALHTFLATVDGQASVVKGDKLLLLDDSNSYWWLVRVLKTQAIGYIPAENIETPWERLARLNKHRNVDVRPLPTLSPCARPPRAVLLTPSDARPQLTSATQADVLSGPTSTAAQTRFVGRIPPWQQPHPHESRHPYSKGVPASPSHKDHPRNISPSGLERPASSKAKTVLFAAPTYYAHSASGMTSDGEGESMGEGDELEGEEEHEQGEGEVEGLGIDERDLGPDDEQDELAAEGTSRRYSRAEDGGDEGGFDEDDDDERMREASDAEDDDRHEYGRAPAAAASPSRPSATAADDLGPESRRGHSPYALDDGAVPPETAPAHREHWERERDAAAHAQHEAAAAEARWARSAHAQGPAQAQAPRSPSRGPLTVQDLAPPVSHVPADLGLGMSLSPHAGLSPTQPAPQQRVVSPPPATTTSSSTSRSPLSSSASPPLSSSTASASAPLDDGLFVDPAAPTKKLSATPRIARNSTTSALSAGSAAEFDEMLGLGIHAGRGAGDEQRSSAPYAGPVSSSSAPRPGPGPAARAGPSPALGPTGAAGGAAPQRVRGVDLVDPRDPRYDRMLQPTKQAGEDVVYERMVAQQQQRGGPAPLSSAGAAPRAQARPTSGLYASGDEGDEGALGASAGSSNVGEGDKRASASGSDKKRKSGGGIMSLFRKKDKKKKGDEGGAAAAAGGAAGRRSSEDSAQGGSSPTRGGFRRSSSSSSPSLGTSEPRSSADRGGAPSASSARAQGPPGAATAESMFSTDAALRQQELEARQALFHQYGVQRSPGDVSNTMTPRGASGVLVVNDEQQGPSGGGSKRNSVQLLNYPGALSSSSVGPSGALGSPSASSLAPPQRMRPGSLIGSPNMAGGLDVPVLSVMRVFTGAHIDSEATFKTVLLNSTTTAADLVKQAMQRFRLVGSDVTRDDFYLTVKELGGDERPLRDDEHPLRVFEDLSDRSAEGDEAGFQLPPSVKRSSIGSINSISSNLSMHPAIASSGVNDWSDDSAVKFYLHRRGGPSSPLVGSQPGADADASFAQSSSLDHHDGTSSSDLTATTQQPFLGGSSTGSTAATSPSYRFAVRVLIHPSDLPETVVFDPASTAIIPRAVLAERQSRSGGFVDASPALMKLPPRDKVIFFPRNANVSEVIETALDRFGIVDGVVDGGDEVEDRVNRRRSQARVKYGLAVQRDGQGASLFLFCVRCRPSLSLSRRRRSRFCLAARAESFLNASSKLLDAYSTAPLFRAYDRSSREFRRRSADATLILGTASDVQPHDPTFVIRRSPVRPGAAARGAALPQTIDELEKLQQRRAAAAQHAEDVGSDDEQEVLEDSSPNPEASRGKSQRDLIAAQRAAQRANQSALLSARGNDGHGFDITVPQEGTIRSSRADEGDEVRYSFVHQDGTETDISEIVEDEWHGGATPTRASSSPAPPPQQQRPTQGMSRAASAATTTDADSFVTATGSLAPMSDDEDDDERRAVDALRSTSVDVERAGSPRDHQPRPLALNGSATSASYHDDHLRSALGPRPMTSPVMEGPLQERLDRVLARVKEEKARRAASPTGSFGWRPRSYISNGGSATASGRTSPAASTSARSASALSGRRSPFGDVLRDSPSIDQLMSSSSALHSPRTGASGSGFAPGGSGSASSPRQRARNGSGSAPFEGHAKKASIASLSSAGSTAATTDQLSTPLTAASSSSQHFTPASSSNSNYRAGSQPQGIAYRDDYGYETLAAIVSAAAAARPAAARPAAAGAARAAPARDSVDERLFGRELDVENLHPEVRRAYEVPAKAFGDLDEVRSPLSSFHSSLFKVRSLTRFPYLLLYSASTPSCASSSPSERPSLPSLTTQRDLILDDLASTLPSFFLDTPSCGRSCRHAAVSLPLLFV